MAICFRSHLSNCEQFCNSSLAWCTSSMHVSFCLSLNSLYSDTAFQRSCWPNINVAAHDLNNTFQSVHTHQRPEHFWQWQSTVLCLVVLFNACKLIQSLQGSNRPPHIINIVVISQFAFSYRVLRTFPLRFFRPHVCSTVPDRFVEDVSMLLCGRN